VGVGPGLYMYDVVVKSSRSLSHLLVSSCLVSASLLQRRRPTKLAVFWAGTRYIHFRGLLPPGGILPGAKFTLRPNHAFSYIGSVTARNSSSRRQPNFAACYKQWNYRTFSEGPSHVRLGGHRVGRRPTF